MSTHSIGALSCFECETVSLLDKDIDKEQVSSTNNKDFDVPNEITVTRDSSIELTPCQPKSSGLKMTRTPEKCRGCNQCSNNMYCVNCNIKLNHILNGDDTPNLKCSKTFSNNSNFNIKNNEAERVARYNGRMSVTGILRDSLQTKKLFDSPKPNECEASLGEAT